MKMNRILTLGILMVAMFAFVSGLDQVFAQTATDPTAPGYAGDIPMSQNSQMSDALTLREKSGNMRSITNRMREAAAAARTAASQTKTGSQRMAAAPLSAPLAAAAPLINPLGVMNPGGTPDYFTDFLSNTGFQPVAKMKRERHCIFWEFCL